MRDNNRYAETLSTARRTTRANSAYDRSRQVVARPLDRILDVETMLAMQRKVGNAALVSIVALRSAGSGQLNVQREIVLADGQKFSRDELWSQVRDRHYSLLQSFPRETMTQAFELFWSMDPTITRTFADVSKVAQSFSEFLQMRQMARERLGPLTDDQRAWAEGIKAGAFIGKRHSREGGVKIPKLDFANSLFWLKIAIREFYCMAGIGEKERKFVKDPVRLYRGLALSPGVECPKEDLLPASTTWSLQFAIEWARQMARGKNMQAVVLEMTVPQDVRMFVQSYPGGTIDGDPKPLNQDQQEVTIAPSAYRLHRSYVHTAGGEPVTIYQVVVNGQECAEVLLKVERSAQEGIRASSGPSNTPDMLAVKQSINSWCVFASQELESLKTTKTVAILLKKAEAAIRSLGGSTIDATFAREGQLLRDMLAETREMKVTEGTEVLDSLWAQHVVNLKSILKDVFGVDEPDEGAD